MSERSRSDVWIAPEDLCLLAAIENGWDPSRCTASTSTSYEDHILVGLTTKQVRALWKLGGCRDPLTGGPLLAHDGRLMCAFEQSSIPAPHIMAVDDHEGPRSYEEYRKHLRDFKKIQELHSSTTPEEKGIIKGKARTAAHKLVSRKDMMGPYIKRAHEYETCLANHVDSIKKAIAESQRKAKGVQNEINANINAGITMKGGLQSYRDKIVKVREELDDKVNRINEAVVHTCLGPPVDPTDIPAFHNQNVFQRFMGGHPEDTV